MNKKLLDKYVIVEITREARINLKLMAILQNKEQRIYLSDLINEERKNYKNIKNK